MFPGVASRWVQFAEAWNQGIERLVDERDPLHRVVAGIGLRGPSQKPHGVGAPRYHDLSPVTETGFTGTEIPLSGRIEL